MAAAPSTTTPTVAPAPDPGAPLATGGVTVIPKTAAQQKRSSSYTWLAAIGTAIPWTLMIVGDVSPQITALFHHHKDLVMGLCGLAGAIGLAARARQLGSSAKDAATANYTP